MSSALATSSAEKSLSLSDFELVRNAAGEWLLIVGQLPHALTDNPLAEISATLANETLALHGQGVTVQLNSILSGQYAAALALDKPSGILLCVVDDDGVQQLSRRIALTI